MIFPWRRLRQQGVLGINQRNADYILPFNPRHHYPLVDDKRRTKQLALAAGIAVPKLYGVVEMVHQIKHLDKLLGPHEDFVIKPAHGSGGEGILVVNGRYQGRYRKASGVILSAEEIGHHIANILSGMYSLGGLPDTALIEYRVKFDPLFEAVSYLGVPDIRTLVYRGIPALAMIRLPTRLSDGRANLHQGAIGVGIDLVTGLTSAGVWQEHAIDRHPDTEGEIRNLRIPHWESILELAARCFDLVNLGYIGVDIVLDRDLGPMVLELNARPGLSIQLANKVGLQPRLQRIQRLSEIPSSAAERVALGKALL
ncbi:alpha-L-glutamate ligase-like protein [Nitrosococcus watsonii]|uniref:Alpha-L-glutamate ligase-like protein n=1 Tax=Nitrosococcus watsoni (strain C-113) TaxID=105559 RepID=D8K7A7_NITWC|nr:alpha-L-glutamate ligase-like protein [Nitrosococcus watsonii]ADJ28784.1 alpha-L-glutamate ligase-like protein [Nitrosococcus watsonii C-113]